MSEIIIPDNSIKTLNNIKSAIYRHPKDLKAYEDFFQFNRLVGTDDLKGNIKPTLENNLWVRNRLNEFIRSKPDSDTVIKSVELMKRTYLYSAKDIFTDYMTYIEWDRKPKERFWLPRSKVLGKLANAMQMLVDDELDELFLSMPPRVGKALANDTPILTRNGWKNHGDLEVGDEVIGMDGKFKKVIAVHPKCQLDVMMEFTNGEKVQCHENHEWLLYDRASGEIKQLETKEWEKRTLEYGGKPVTRGHRYVLQLPKHEAIAGTHRDFELDPYTLGAWLGDGNNNAARICGDKKDYAIIEKIISNGEKVVWSTEHKITHVMYYGFGFRNKLRKYGMCHSRKRSNKTIPEEYLTSDINQRLELLAGLLDTDGTLVKKDNRYQFTTNEESLRDSFVQLISTFGWRASCSIKEPHVSSSGIRCNKPYYVISFNPDMYIPCALERKQLHTFSKQRVVSLKSISRVEPKEGNCITVEGDGMYLCGHSMIPTHNTTMMLFFVTWIIGKDSEKSNLYSAFSDVITSAFYQGVLEVLSDPTTYAWGDVFDQKIAGTNAKDETLDIGRKKRYHSLVARSLYGTLNGACDASGILISDDLIGGIEEALNKDRLISAWSKVDNNLIPRAKESCKLLWVGTRWSNSDPAGLRMNILQTDSRFKGHRYSIINLPALNEKGESNFEYDYGVGFSTKYYQMRKASFNKNNDDASWFAQYMGQPVERSGTLFESTEMKYYNGELPDESTLIRKFAACDPAFGGGDYCSMPICYQYESGTYIVDVVYSNASKNYTQPTIANRIMEWELDAVQFECNASTVSFKEKIEEFLRERKYRCNITYKAAPNNVSKEVRIYDKAPEIRDFYFLEGSKRNSEYEQFMNNVFSFQISGKNKHDDSVDSLAMCVEMQNYSGQTVKVRHRYF